MPAVFHVFQEFANDFYNAKSFHIDVRFRFACRFVECLLPIGIWVILVTQGRDLAIYTAPYLSPLWGTAWALSIIGGPLAAIVLYGLHAIPLEEPLPSTVLLQIEFFCDAFFFVCWLIQTCVTATVLHINNLDCPYVWHRAPSTYYATGEEPSPVGNASFVTVFVPRSATVGLTSSFGGGSVTGWTATSAVVATATGRSTLSPAWNGVTTSPGQTLAPHSNFITTASPARTTTTTTSASPHATTTPLQTTPPPTTPQPATITLTILESQTCYPFQQTLTPILTLLTLLYLTSLLLDAHSYMKGKYWDYESFTSTSRVETMATLRKAERFGVGSVGGGKGEFARGRKNTAFGAGRGAGGSRPGSRPGSVVGGVGQMRERSQTASGSTTGGSVGNLSVGSSNALGLVAGKGALSGLKKEMSGSLPQLNRVDSLSNMKGSACGTPRVVDSEMGPGLSALKGGVGQSVTPKRSRAGSVSSLLKKGGK
ncbi:hypothetical protein HDU98_003108 [Podochytrium sp. JEL0797]|nr:hypothetical protein HDU98_003108 [Podochytrium sp. JEL0797]